MKPKPETDAERLVFIAHRYGQSRVQAEMLQRALEDLVDAKAGSLEAAKETLKRVMDWKNVIAVVEE